MKRTILNFSFLFFISIAAISQVAINSDGSSADANTMLDIKSSNKGVKFPRVTTTERKAISVTTADAGLMVYDTDRQVIYMYDGNEWLPFAISTNPVELIKKKMPAGSPLGNFGFACAVSGIYAVVGAYNDSVGNNYSRGSAYTYKKINGNWTLQNRVIASDGTSDDYFGKAVAIDGDYMAIGAEAAPNASNITSGAVYIFARNGDNWVEQAKLTANDGALNNKFGYSVAIEGAVVIAGAYATKVGNNLNQGAAYIFTRTGNSWAQQTKLVANDGTTDSYFGGSVAINNNDLVVGASGGLVNGIKQGAAYVFTKVGNNWTFLKKLVTDNANGNAGGNFGVSVSISNNLIAVGASKESYYSFERTGVVHIFYRSGATWLHASFEGPITKKIDMNFGIDVVLKNNTLFVSAQNDNVSDFVDQGSVYVYKWNVNYYFELLKRITDPNGVTNDRFGTSVAFDGSSYMVGVPYAKRAAGLSGAGLVFFGALD